MQHIGLLSLTCLSLLACSPAENASPVAPPQGSASEVIEVSQEKNIDEIAVTFVKLALAFGEYDKDYVDAYTGPEEWRDEVLDENKQLDELFTAASSLKTDLEFITPAADEARRLKMLKGNVGAMLARMRMVRGETLSFDEETALIYDVIVPKIDTSLFDDALIELDKILPGEGSIATRRNALQAQLEVSEEKVEPLIRAAIKACRERTLAYYDLPKNEKFILELVRDKPWSGYNWYQGEYESLIQINMDQPFRITRALDLGCHEGYPGHHVWNIFVERDRLKERDWAEYYVFPLFSPGAFFAEGSANYGIDMAFPEAEKRKFEQEVLFPLADIDPSVAELLPAVAKASEPLQLVSVYVAREYLDGHVTHEEAIELLHKYNLVTKERAEQSLDFMDTYRGYIINYSLGYNMVRDYIEATTSTEEERWQAFETLLREPTSASDIALN